MRNQQPLSGKLYDKVIALLAYLIVESGQSHTRERLAMLLWPAFSSDIARGNLRQTLYYLRQIFHTDAASLLSSNRNTVQFLHDESRCRIDLKRFTQPAPICLQCATTSVSTPCETCLNHLAMRVDAYQGEFLAGLSLTDAPDFDIWLEAQRLSLRGQAFALAEQLSHAHETQGRLDTALSYALRCIELEPWNESGHRQHMRLLASKGQHGAAQAFYDAYSNKLERDLNVEPDQSTQALFESIHKGGLQVGAPLSSTLTPTIPRVETGRRQATILCCHVGLPPNFGTKGPEQLAAPRSVCASVLRRYAGHIALGQGGYIYAYTGYPQASEHAGLQAVQAALELQACLMPHYRLRIGIHTGIIVTGFDPALPDIIGNVSAIAWQLCRRMQRTGIVISESTRRLVHGRFRLQTLKPMHVKEDSADANDMHIPVYKLIGPSQTSGRVTVPHAGLIGRQQELQRLKRLWRLALSGQAQFLALRGEAGLGKTRIARALIEQTDPTNSIVRHLHCYSEHQHTPFYPIISMFEATLGFTDDDTVIYRREKLNQHLVHHHPAIASRAFPILMAMLSIAPPQAPVLPPRQRKQQTLDMLLTLLDSIAMRGTLLLIIEDAQWLDVTSLQLLERLVHRQNPVALFTLITARCEFTPAWLQANSVLELQPLKDKHIARLAQAASRSSLSSQLIGHIIQRADGIPLYAEEMAQLSSHSVHDAIPASLQYLLRVRLEAVPHARRLLQLAATIGRKFGHDLLQRVSALDNEKLDAILHELTEARLIELIEPQDAVFQFRHALLQEAAYTSQVQADMQQAHLQVATMLSTHYAQRTAQQPGEIARHYTAADDAEAALPWWLAAGRKALRVSANAEARDYLQTGLDLVAKLPHTPERKAMEREFLLPLGQALLLLRGYGSEDAVAVYDRALTLDEASVSPRQRFEILWGQWMVSSSRPGSGFRHSWDITQQLLQLARDSGDDELLVQAYSAAANITLWRNQLDDACRYARAAIGHPTATTGSTIEGLDPRVTSLAHLSWAYWRLEQVSDALAVSRQSVKLAQSRNAPDTLCFALAFAAMLHRFLGQTDSMARLAQQIRQAADSHQLVLWRGIGDMLLGWKQAHDGQEEGLITLKACVQGVKQIMPGVAVMFIHAQAEAYGFLGRHKEQLRIIDEGLQTAQQVHEGFFNHLLEQLRHQCPAYQIQQ
ncbi:AAA family ATPase [Pusillimonas harenae]|uniref:AAA family ATPase n=2 Tax=Pollutimonas harenae TaxID=657015 RepID=A0A853GSN2_9BURK|nr:AAA family ATPase [Pollutimonas harenae]TEA71547.1 guanylate cyclase [Pollutimonas harenae]